VASSSSPATAEVLVLASRFDFTCDYVVAALRRRGVSYLRLNSEDLSECSITLDPLVPRLDVRLPDDSHFVLTEGRLRSVLFRRPVYLRDYGDDRRSAQDRFCRIQWAALMQNLSVFQSARWYNDPASTYRAEHKAIQLNVANRLGLSVPPTVVTNEPSIAVKHLPGDAFAVKGLDTVMVRESGDEVFGFTTFASQQDFEDTAWVSAPTTIQWVVPNKVDIRVTVIGPCVLAAAILVDQAGVADDWRLHKGHTAFISHELPVPISAACVELVADLGLRFGAIDLALSNGRYYFLEINPTGEWAWLVDAAGLPIDEVLADELAR
jgi:glutathione synthase/RimK-type ligase-like ATP-grasp enzyme